MALGRLIRYSLGSLILQGSAIRRKWIQVIELGKTWLLFVIKMDTIDESDMAN